MNLRRKLGKLAIIFAVLSIIWLALGMFNFVPLILMIPGETLIRSHATLPYFVFYSLHGLFGMMINTFINLERITYD